MGCQEAKLHDALDTGAAPRDHTAFDILKNHPRSTTVTRKLSVQVRGTHGHRAFQSEGQNILQGHMPIPEAA